MGMDVWYLMWSLIMYFAYCFFIMLMYHWGIDCTVRVSRQIFAQVTGRLLHAPIDRLYDKHPVGRVMNRLTSDVHSLDLSLYSKHWSPEKRKGSAHSPISVAIGILECTGNMSESIADIYSTFVHQRCHKQCPKPVRVSGNQRTCA